MELTNWRRPGGQSSYRKEWDDYCNKVNNMRKIIRDRFIECGGKPGDLQGHYNRGGEEASRKHVENVIGELESSMLFSQLDSIVKPKYS